ncbi:MAG: L-2-amino-thiazoline-4-carboxylic acid hydrolase [Anaeromicrobium sp.]|uniref:L-2-amino-thiazoline-4-carboxylic acid hydrolase n=1 Tax=Anaeromicrobium sp. TaxID=1929132 RepID=UPI0025D8EBB8|nr:L-2-amino-thiazoline-4-carboxylic acid hydrolase [Anaeromicrobium sp.]MCT4596047.1 L-2-amino-thiazoline-4-carboxylic acid hydrolase [Anaeromicrobium sp.]
MKQNQYYISQEGKLIKDLEAFLKLILPKLIEEHDERKAMEIYNDTLREYKKLISQLPYIGGKENRLTSNLIQASWGLALYRTILIYGGTVEQAGELITRGFEMKLNKIPTFLRHLMGKLMFFKRNVAKMKKRAEISQLREYPCDWVWHVFEGDRNVFDVGIDYTECGIEKFIHSQGADELIPYLCNLDYVLFGKLGIELIRTKTLAWGCDCCDFRIKKNGTPSSAWPPQFLEKTCDNKMDQHIK